jgi:hypothetical protein
MGAGDWDIVEVDRGKKTRRVRRSIIKDDRSFAQDLLPMPGPEFAPTATEPSIVLALVPRDSRPLLLRGMRLDKVQQMRLCRSQRILLSELSVRGSERKR